MVGVETRKSNERVAKAAVAEYQKEHPAAAAPETPQIADGPRRI